MTVRLQIGQQTRKVEAFAVAVSKQQVDVRDLLSEHADEWSQDATAQVAELKLAYRDAVAKVGELRRDYAAQQALARYYRHEGDASYKAGSGGHVRALKSVNGSPYDFASVIDALLGDVEPPDEKPPLRMLDRSTGKMRAIEDAVPRARPDFGIG